MKPLCSLLLVVTSIRLSTSFQILNRNGCHTGQPSCHSARDVVTLAATRQRQSTTSLDVNPLEDAYNDEYGPLPTMPSPLFCNLAHSQMELLAFSVDRIKAMSLYLPQENLNTGQLEFLPGILYPTSDRVFIANDAKSGEAPMLPRTLTRLPGFEHATSLLPKYPMVLSTGEAGVGQVEEVMCDPITKTSALSVPMFQGSQTVGVLLVWSKPSTRRKSWSQNEKEQISRAAQSLSLALSMDTERKVLQTQSETLQTQLSDALHQVKNPIQALRTYGKLLQQKLADSTADNDEYLSSTSSPQLLELARHLMVQSDRVVDLMSPFDTIVNSLPASTPLALNPYNAPASPQHTALTPWKNATINDFPQEKKKTPPPRARKRGRPPSKSMDFVRPVAKASRTTSNGNNNTLQFGTTEVISAIGYSNGTLDFSRDTVTNPTVSKRKRKTTTVDVRKVEENENGQEQLEMGFVMDILEPILDAGKVFASEQGITLEIRAASDLPGVWVHPKALQEAFSNVLDNALKYVALGSNSSGDNNTLRVVVEAQRHSPEPGVVLAISDNGPGISSEDVPSIFERGYRGTRTLSLEGSGIGLDIARSMLARMGGELRLRETSMTRGTVFEIVLYRNAANR